MLFGVPTMYRRLADAAEADPDVARALGGARLIVSGSAALPAAEHARIERLTGQRVVERYGMTETLMNTASTRTATGAPVRRPAGARASTCASSREGEDAGRGIGEIQVRGPNLFLGYLNRPDATAEAMRPTAGFAPATWRRATRRLHPDRRAPRDGPHQERRLQDRCRRDRERAARAPGGRRGGGRRRAGRGPRRADRGVGRGRRRAREPEPRELADHVARLLTPHKRPRVVRYVDELPRNAMGKVQKKLLTP